MALSNIFREPRREITETLVGIVAAIVFMVLPCYFGSWLSHFKDGPPLLLGAMLGLALEGFVVGMFFFIHFIGEEVCDWLDDRGLALRPRNRR